jgi:hypothetical protein
VGDIPFSVCFVGLFFLLQDRFLNLTRFLAQGAGALAHLVAMSRATKQPAPNCWAKVFAQHFERSEEA